jgi:sulfite reductase (NADPH) flavoprotein alpha-component
MNAFSPSTPPMPLIPETAPFSPAQRAWLNGFLAGLYGGTASGGGSGGMTTTALPPPAEPEDFPWHDPAMELPERMTLAEGRPLAQKLMAAMGQLDCGQCGYLCQSYAEALAAGGELSPTLCVPGAKATARMVKQLLADAPVLSPGPAAVTPHAAPVKPVTRDVRVISAAALTAPGSSKDVRHVVIDLAASGITYEPGDSIGLAAPADPILVAACLAALGLSGDEIVRGPDGVERSLRETFSVAVDIARPLDRTTDLLAMSAKHPRHAAALRLLSEGADGAEPADADLLDLLEAFPSARPPLADLVASLPALRPRLYSIASSPRATPGEVHLCVAVVREQRHGRMRNGVASAFLADRATGPGDEWRAVPAYIQTSHFRPPADPATPVIMVGPGTGVAPFRAFLAERGARGIRGRSWLMFGERNRATDFLFEAELLAWLKDGTLSRLDTAFSRDQGEKVYVQDRMRESAEDVWRWLQDGAYFYVCGDAMRMAKDVDATLRRIAMTEGRMDEAQARDWIVALARQGRYLRDVY